MQLRLERSAIALNATRLVSGLVAFVSYRAKSDKPLKGGFTNNKEVVGDTSLERSEIPL